MMVGLMVVTIEQHQIATGQQRIGYHFIGRRRAVQHEVGFIRVEHFRRELLRVLGRTFVDQQITELHVGIAHIGTKHVFTEEFVKLPPRRVFFEKGTVLVTRTGKGAVSHRHILAQGVKKGWQQVLFIPAGGRFQFQQFLCFTGDDRRDTLWHLSWLC